MCLIVDKFKWGVVQFSSKDHQGMPMYNLTFPKLSIIDNEITKEFLRILVRYSNLRKTEIALILKGMELVKEGRSFQHKKTGGAII